MTNIGLCSVTFREKTPQEILEWMSQSLLHAIEWAGDAHANPDETTEYKENLAEITKEAGLTISSYGSYYFAGEDQDFEPILETAKALNTKDIRIWAGAMDRAKKPGEIDPDQQQKVIEDIKRVAQLAAKEEINIHLEYHRWTYTDTAEDTLHLLEQVAEPNVFSYWQPMVEATVEERVKNIHTLGSWISNVHTFYWDTESRRFPLNEGSEAWAQYIDALEQYPYKDRHYLMEFVKDNDEKQALEDAQVLSGLLH